MSNDLITYITAIGNVLFQQIEDYARDTIDGPGWSIVVDIDRAPDEVLPWLGQMVGLQVDVGATPDEQRAFIKDLANYRRGTRDSMIKTAQTELTGNKVVLVRERDTSAYHMSVVTYTSETPDTSKVLAKLISQKPAGVVLAYNTTTGDDYTYISITFATYQDVLDTYDTYAGVLLNEPGT